MCMPIREPTRMRWLPTTQHPGTGNRKVHLPGFAGAVMYRLDRKGFEPSAFPVEKDLAEIIRKR